MCMRGMRVCGMCVCEIVSAVSYSVWCGERMHQIPLIKRGKSGNAAAVAAAHFGFEVLALDVHVVGQLLSLPHLHAQQQTIRHATHKR